MKVFLLILLAGVLLVILAPVIRLGVAAVGTPADRAAANQTLRSAADLLGGQFRDRLEYPWYRRPAQYGPIPPRWPTMSARPSPPWTPA